MAQRLIEGAADEFDKHIGVAAVGAQEQAVAPVCETIPITEEIRCHHRPSVLEEQRDRVHRPGFP
jgi:hypothetical protein